MNTRESKVNSYTYDQLIINKNVVQQGKENILNK